MDFSGPNSINMKPFLSGYQFQGKENQSLHYFYLNFLLKFDSNLFEFQMLLPLIWFGTFAQVRMKLNKKCHDQVKFNAWNSKCVFQRWTFENLVEKNCLKSHHRSVITNDHK